MASGYKLGGALLGVALAVTSPLKAQDANLEQFSPKIIETLDDTKNYVAIINGGRIDTYTISPKRFVGGKPECRNIEGWGETYILKGKQNIEVLVNDNPLDPVEWSRLTYQKGGKTGNCTETSKVCIESIVEFTKRVEELTLSPKCGDNQIVSN